MTLNEIVLDVFFVGGVSLVVIAGAVGVFVLLYYTYCWYINERTELKEKQLHMVEVELELLTKKQSVEKLKANKPLSIYDDKVRKLKM